MNKNLKVLFFTLIVLFVFTLSSCNNVLEENDYNEISSERLNIISDYPITDKLEEMIIESDLIVVGKYTSFDTTWNMARNPDDIAQEDTEIYIEGKLYNFTVETILKGSEVDDIIKVNHRHLEKYTYTYSDAVVNSQGIIEKDATFTKDYAFDKKDSLFIEPELDTKYILFLKKDVNMGNYYGAIEPFSIKFDSDDIAELQSNLINLDGQNNFTSEISIDDDIYLTIVEEFSSGIKDNISSMTFNDILAEINN